MLDSFTQNVFNFNESKNPVLIQKCISYINEHYNEDINLETVANIVHLNPSYFSSIFKKEVGVSFSNYLNKIRIEQSKLLLKNTDSSKERTYSVVRIHGEKAEVIDSTFDEASSTLTFATDRFSVYAVVYEDKTKSLEITKPDNENTGNNVDKPSSSEKVTPDDSQNTNAAPETGDSFGKDIMAASFAMIICAMGAAYVLMTRKRRQF